MLALWGQNVRGNPAVVNETQDRRLPPLFVAALGLASFGVFLQAVIAGVFVNQEGRDGWVDVHGVVADVTWVAALVAAAVAFRRIRHSHRFLTWGTGALFVLALAQTGLGHLITDGGMDGLIVIHVPLAVLIFGLATWLLVELRRARSAVAGSAHEPYVDEPARNPLPVAYDG